MNVEISKSDRKNKKYKAVINGGKTIHFGHSAYQDYTTHKDEQRKQSYISRHSNEDHSKQNMTSAAYLSRHLLWNKPSLKGSISDLNKKYSDVRFTYKTQ